MSCWRALLRLLTANAQQLTETHLAPLWTGLEASLTFAAAYPSSQAGAISAAFASQCKHVVPTSTRAHDNPPERAVLSADGGLPLQHSQTAADSRFPCCVQG